MKRIGIISDTHSCRDPRFALHFKDCDEIWHAGDIGDIDTLKYFANMGPRLRAVCGNIDSTDVRRHCPELLEFEVEGVSVIMTHIGGYPGKWAPGIKKMLMEKRPTMMVDGHSHILKVIYDRELNVLHVNPGAAGTQGWQRERTLIRLTIDGDSVRDLEVIELGKKII